MLIPHFRILVEWYIRLTELLTACLMLILIVAQIIAKQTQVDEEIDLHLCILIALVAIPCTVAFAVVLNL